MNNLEKYETQHNIILIYLSASEINLTNYTGKVLAQQKPIIRIHCLIIPIHYLSLPLMAIR